jgi:hypothetical protein
MDWLALITPPKTTPTAPTAPLRVLGIALGTTNSTVAEISWQPGDPDAPRARCLEVELPPRQEYETAERRKHDDWLDAVLSGTDPKVHLAQCPALPGSGGNRWSRSSITRRRRADVRG